MSLIRKLAFVAIALNIIGDLLALSIFSLNGRENAEQKTEKERLNKTIDELRERLNTVEKAYRIKKIKGSPPKNRFKTSSVF